MCVGMPMGTVELDIAAVAMVGAIHGCWMAVASVVDGYGV